MKILILLFMYVMRHANGVIYSLNETEYDRLPPLFKLDDFYPCLRAAGDRYCYVDARLTANTSSKLLHVIQEYSANNVTHYDHNLIHWGICVTKTCREHLGNSTDLNVALEACINSSLYQTHQLQANLVEDQVYCTEFGEMKTIDTWDLVVAIVLGTILALNVLGSLYDLCSVSKKSLGGRFLICFSVKRNWKRLIAPSEEGGDPRLTRLKLFKGIKVCTTFLVVLGHSLLAALISSNNPHFVELTYYDPVYQIFYNGHLIVQRFFVVSGFLLAFNLLLMEETTTLTASKIPKFVMLRWLRLTPPYAAVLVLIATWVKRIGDGPMWKPVVEVESGACRSDWFYHILYLNDYVDHSLCMAHTWYLAVDMKLTVFALLVFCLMNSWRARKIAISIAFIAGLVAPAVSIYLQNLNGILIVSPEFARRHYVEDQTFNNLYKRTHTNIVCYTMGLALGMWVYKRMQIDLDVTKYKKYRILFWSTIPISVLLAMCGSVFYIDGIQVPLLARVTFTPLIKLMFGLLEFVLILGTIFKLDTVYRGFLEWNGWAVFSRISYCAYIVHMTVIRVTTANHTSLLHANILQMLLTYFAHVVTSFILALPCWMLIEAPFNQLVKLCFYPAPTKKEPAPISIVQKETTGVKPVFTFNERKKDLDGTVVSKL